MLSHALETNWCLPESAGRLYTVTGARAAGVFHPKLILQLGRNKARLVVSSANMTAAGLAGNLEVAGVIETDGTASGEAELIAAAWQYVGRFTDLGGQAIRNQIDWAIARTRWLEAIQPAAGYVRLKDGTRSALMTTGGTRGIAEQFLASVAGSGVDRLICISPYWDDGLEALRYLLANTQPREGVVLLDNGRHEFPVDALPQDGSVTLRDFKAGSAERFIHAKAILAQTQSADHVLFGSANCSVAALGNGSFAGINEEISLYRELPPGTAVDVLALTEVLAASPLDGAEVERIEQSTQDGTEELTAPYPGRFECLFDTLIWWPASERDMTGCDIELAGERGRLLDVELHSVPSPVVGALRFTLTATDARPHFACVRFADGTRSARAIVLLMDPLRHEVREARTKTLQNVIDELDGETEAGLWLLETLNRIEAAESDLAAKGSQPSRRLDRSNGAEAEPATAVVQILAYDRFIAGRRLRFDAQDIPRNSFAGSEVSHVRGFLNRILSIGGQQQSDPTDDDITSAFDTGDDVSEGGTSLEEGFSFDRRRPKQAPEEEDAKKKRMQRQAALRRTNRKDMIEAVHDLREAMVAKVVAGGLKPIDVLRLRAVLSIIIAAGWDGRTQKRSIIQVLPPVGDTEASWPRLIGKALSAYFGGSAPAIKTLAIDGYYDQLPDDILECWGLTFWAANACVIAAQVCKEHPTLTNALVQLRDRVYVLTGLRSDELRHPAIIRMFDIMSDKFGGRLGVDTTLIKKEHSNKSR
jgi:hypothetical protein